MKDKIDAVLRTCRPSFFDMFGKTNIPLSVRGLVLRILLTWNNKKSMKIFNFLGFTIAIAKKGIFVPPEELCPRALDRYKDHIIQDLEEEARKGTRGVEVRSIIKGKDLELASDIVDTLDRWGDPKIRFIIEFGGGFHDENLPVVRPTKLKK